MRALLSEAVDVGSSRVCVCVLSEAVDVGSSRVCVFSLRL